MGEGDPRYQLKGSAEFTSVGRKIPPPKLEQNLDQRIREEQARRQAAAERAVEERAIASLVRKLSPHPDDTVEIVKDGVPVRVGIDDYRRMLKQAGASPIELADMEVPQIKLGRTKVIINGKPVWLSVKEYEEYLENK